MPKQSEIKQGELQEREITVEITDYCPHKCKYCSSVTTQDRTGANYLSVDKIKKLLGRKTYEHIIISGGEPLSHPQFYDILELCKQYSEDVVVYSNAISHLIYNQSVIDGVYLEANVTILPEVDRVHILRRVKQGKEANRPAIHLSRNFSEDCSCNHRVIRPNGEAGLRPCNKWNTNLPSHTESKEEQMNRIEEVKKILTIMDNDSVGKHGLHGYMVKDYAKQICQLFPQPLDDKELREKARDLLINCSTHFDSDQLDAALDVFDQILDELQPKIEEAFNEGVEKNKELLARVKQCQDVIKDLKSNLVSNEEARGQGENRIIKWVEDHCVFTGRGAGTMEMKIMKWWWEALSGKGGVNDK